MPCQPASGACSESIGVYRCPNKKVDAVVAYTNSLPAGAFDAIVNCTGIAKDPTATVNPVRSLLDQGLARIDPLHTGIDVAFDCAVVNRRGFPSQRLFAVGPLTRAAFWEIVAIPDICNQCVRLAERLVGNADRISEPHFLLRLRR